MCSRSHWRRSARGTDGVVMVEYTEDYGDGTSVLPTCGAGMNLIFRGMMCIPEGDSAQRPLPVFCDIGALAAIGGCRCRW